MNGRTQRKIDTQTYTRLPRSILALVVVVTFLFAEFFGEAVKTDFVEGSVGWERFAWFSLFIYAPRILLSLAVAAVVFGPSQVWRVLGLDRPVLPAIAFALLVSAPMAIALALSFEPIPADKVGYALVRGALAPGLTEEIMFRAFFFGILFRFACIGFIPAALITSMIFGGLHMWQGGEPFEAVKIFLITGVGGFWFAWLFTEWEFNAWVPISVHIVMNGWWELFDVSDTALGNEVAADLSRVVVIALSIVVTWARARSRGGFVLSRKSLL